MCGCGGGGAAWRERTARVSVGTAGGAVATIAVGPARIAAAEVRINGAATVELRSPRGGVVETATATGAGVVTLRRAHAAFASYTLHVSASAGTVDVAAYIREEIAR